METLVEVQCISIFTDKTQVALCGLDFVVHEGERVVVWDRWGRKNHSAVHILGLLSPVELGTCHGPGTREFPHHPPQYQVVFQNVDEQIIGPTVFDDHCTPRNERIKG